MDDTTPYYGASTEGTTLTLGEKLREYYDPEDFVTVINIDTSPLKYQFTSPSDIETFSDYPGHKDTVMKRPPQVVILQPGESKLCPAYEADLMIENLIKQITTRKANQDAMANGVAFATATWTDPQTQDALIKKIFVGKKDILGTYNQSLTAPDVEKDLVDSGKSGSARKASQAA